MSGSIPRSTDGLLPLWILEPIIPSMVLRSHYGTAFDPIHVLGSGRVSPVIKRDRPWDGSIDDCLGEGQVQSPSEQEDRSLGISLPLCDFPKVVECHDVGVKILSLHLNS